VTLVDSYVLQFEVQPEYPYSTVVVDTEDEVIEKLDWEKRVHGVSCRVRVIGPWAKYYGAPS
jgi:hypothetical protein